MSLNVSEPCPLFTVKAFFFLSFCFILFLHKGIWLPCAFDRCPDMSQIILKRHVLFADETSGLKIEAYVRVMSSLYVLCF